MREYDEYDDDSIRLYTPVLQRVVILAAVVIAVPVLMWTITTFVRSYVARPKVPLVEHVASTNAPTRVPLLAAPPLRPSDTDQAASARGAIAAASEPSNPTGEIKTGTVSLASLPESSPASPTATGPSAASMQAAPVPAPSPAPATGDASAANAPTAGAASAPRQTQATRPTDSMASASNDRGTAWPNPNATSPPDFAAPRTAPSSPTRTAAVEILPPDEPLAGPIPLPRQRPSILAMAATTTSPGNGAVPLPRARPGDAPATDTAVDLPATGRFELESPH